MTRPDSEKLSGYAHLKQLLRTLEEDLGLGDLTPLERNILAALSLDEFRGGARSEDMLDHALLDSATKSSFYRALGRLRARNLVRVVGSKKTGRYTLG